MESFLRGFKPSLSLWDSSCFPRFTIRIKQAIAFEVTLFLLPLKRLLKILYAARKDS